MSAAPVPARHSYIADCSYHPTITQDPKTPREHYLFSLAGGYEIEDVCGTVMYDGASVVIVNKPHKPRCAECVYGRMCIAGTCRKKSDANDEWQSCGGAPIFLKRQFISTPWEPAYEADADKEVYDHSLCKGDDCEAVWACYNCGEPITIEKDALPDTVAPLKFCFTRLTDTITHVTRSCECAGGCGMELFSRRHLLRLDKFTRTTDGTLSAEAIQIPSVVTMCDRKRQQAWTDRCAELQRKLDTMNSIADEMARDSHALPSDWCAKASAAAARIVSLETDMRDSRKRQRLLDDTSACVCS